MGDIRFFKTEDEVVSTWRGDLFKPLVSISCVTYNHSQYIADALEGFLRQETEFPFEVLVHDDASTDGTADIVREYESRFPRIIKPIYQVENQYSKGKMMSPEFNFPRALGKYIALCEGDDYWTDPNKLTTQVEFLESYPNCVMCFHPAEVIQYRDKGYAEKFTKSFGEIEIFGRENLFYEGFHAPTASMVFNKSAVSSLPDWFYSAPVCDMPLKLIMFARGDIGFVNKAMSVRRFGTDGSWNVRTRSNRQNEHRYLVKMIEMLGNFNSYSGGKWSNDVAGIVVSYEMRKNRTGQSRWVNIIKDYPDFWRSLKIFQKVTFMARLSLNFGRFILAKSFG